MPKRGRTARQQHASGPVCSLCQSEQHTTEEHKQQCSQGYQRFVERDQEYQEWLYRHDYRY